MNKKLLSERDICTKFITPALRSAGWDEMSQVREEVNFTKGRIMVRGKLVTRGKAKRADYCLSRMKDNKWFAFSAWRTTMKPTEFDMVGPAPSGADRPTRLELRTPAGE